MRRDVGRYYLDHLHATAGPADLLLRAVEKALWDLANDEDVESFCLRLTRIRRSIRLERGHGEVAGALVRSLIVASRAARKMDFAAAERELKPIVDACAAARPRSAALV